MSGSATELTGTLSGSRRRWRTTAVSAAAMISAIALTTSGCVSDPNASGGDTDGLTTVQTTSMTLAGGHWRELVAQKKGFFVDEGLNVVETSVTPQISVDAVMSGSADISLGDTVKLVQLVDKGGDLVVVGQGVDRSGNSLVAKQGIDSISDLKGATIGLANQVDPYNVILEEMLQDGGVSPDDVQFIYGQGSGDRAGALQGGAIDATLLPPPTDSRLNAEGFPTLGKTTDIAPELSRSSIIANREWAADNADTVEAYLRALHTAAAWLYDENNKAEAVDLMAAETQTTTDITEEAYDEYVTGKQWDIDQCVNVGAVEKLLDRLAPLEPGIDMDVNKYVTTDYCTDTSSD